MVSDIVFYFVHEPELSTCNINYLQYTLKFAVKYSPKCKVWLIGNDNPNIEGVEFVSIESLKNNLTDEFIRYYVPLYNLNPENFTFQSILRTYYMLKLMKQKSIKGILQLDADITMITEVAGIKLTHPVQAYICYDYFKSDRMNCDILSGDVFINDIDFLESFCKFCIELYKNKNSDVYILSEEMRKQKNSYGISIMMLWGLFVKSNRDKFIHNGGIINESIFDITVQQSEGLEMENGLKKVFKEGNIFYGLSEGRKIKINSLHWHGDNKKYIEAFYNKFI